MAAFSSRRHPGGAAGRLAPLSRWLTAVTGMVSLLFGAWVLYEFGFAAALRGAV
jgi:hypothetical protein